MATGVATNPGDLGKGSGVCCIPRGHEDVTARPGVAKPLASAVESAGARAAHRATDNSLRRRCCLKLVKALATLKIPYAPGWSGNRSYHLWLRLVGCCKWQNASCAPKAVQGRPGHIQHCTPVVHHSLPAYALEMQKV